jgi:hypothetical protein
MKKSELKQVISEIVRRKLEEANAKNPTYGYVMKPEKGDDPNDPRLQMIGYGNMPKSYWMKKIVKDLDELKKYVQQENWNASAYLIEKNGVLYSMIKMMKEVSSEGIKEQIDMGNEETPTQDPTDVKKKKELVALQKKQADTNDRIRRIDATKQKLEDPIRRKIQSLDIKKAPEVKKLGAITKQIQDLQDK